MQFELTFQRICAFVSVITNSLLMFLILGKSPPQLGTYKWLMLYTSLYELVYTSMNIFVEPSTGTFQSSCYMFQDMKKSMFGADGTLFFILIYCSCYGFSMSIFACHFIYRYGNVNTIFKQKYISGKKHLFLYIAPLLSGFVWGLVTWLTMHESSSKTSFLKIHFEQVLKLNIEECAYVAFWFWPVDEHGEFQPDLISFLGFGIMILILSWSFISVVYFGFNCYKYISKQMGSLSSQSQALKSLQAQLFYSLIFQTAIPCVLMYLPAGIILSVPMFNVGFNLEVPLLSITIAIYPAIDPLPTIFIIKSYRRGLIDMFRCHKKTLIVASS
ncbi:Serpentine receptor class r-10 [Caenorhabditis elegans]|uniref:Serpentine receptor class r-10 n=1 Tax=Caenorhabditis elegans TaxID=6239 RepID=O62506_CAEEL|nr:Seven TM Receptor [Caenorhabditis elegans]CAA19568.2 Seven TM Receptor [Caenorhabditis elegans]|eukprot:NP_507035.2 Seven TM Receptor [Caenorhabditis elegans]